jgi:heme-degrading monooxygenase HmoA
MIARIWKGATKAEHAGSYLDYMRRTGFAELRATPGNLGVMGLRRVAGGRAELMVISLWESEAAIREFAGDDVTRARFYPEDDEYLVARDEEVSHFEVAFRTALGRPAGATARPAGAGARGGFSEPVMAEEP